MKRLASRLLTATILFAFPLAAQVDRTPDLGATVPGGWTTDRYAPCQFSLANNSHGRSNVLQESVCAADRQSHRPAPYSSSFYNTQGMKIGVDGIGVVPSGTQKVSLDLWVDALWSTSTNGLVSTGMWTRVNQVNSDAEATAWYPILGFTNTSGVGSFRYWDSLLGYQSLGATVNYGAWNTFEIDLNDNVFTAYVNGALQYTETAGPGTERLTAMFVNTTNAGDVNSPDGGEFTAEWSNTPEVTAAPEPASLVLMMTGIAGVGIAVRRRKSRM